MKVLPLAWKSAQKQVEKLGGKVVLRMAKGGKMGPIVTDNGNFILDADFGPIRDPAALERQLKSVAGILETGLFIGIASKAYFGQKDGSVASRERPSHDKQK